MSKQELTTEEKINKATEHIKSSLEKILTYAERGGNNYAKQASAKMWIRNVNHLVAQGLRAWVEELYPLDGNKPTPTATPVNTEEKKLELKPAPKSKAKEKAKAKVDARKATTLKEALKKKREAETQANVQTIDPTENQAEDQADAQAEGQAETNVVSI